jgi:hypothetical protein
MAACLGNGGDDGRPLNTFERTKLLFEAQQAWGGHREFLHGGNLEFGKERKHKRRTPMPPMQKDGASERDGTYRQVLPQNEPRKYDCSGATSRVPDLKAAIAWAAALAPAMVV